MDKSIFGVAIALVVAVILFVSTSSMHDADRDVREAKHDKAAAEFDRDFAKASTGKDNPVLAQRAEDAAKALESKKTRQVAVDAEQNAKQQALQGAMEDQLKKDRIDLKAIEAKVNQPKN